MVTMAWPVVDGQQQAPCPRTGNHGAPLEKTLDREAMATHRADGAGPPWGWPSPSQAGQPATVHRGQQNDRGQAMDRSPSFDGPGPNPLIA